MRWLAIFANADGTTAREEVFEYDVHTHESFSMLTPAGQGTLAIDAPGIADKCREFIGGYLEPVSIDIGCSLVVDDEGMRKVLPLNEHPLVLYLSMRRGTPLAGPVVVLMTIPDGAKEGTQ